jgi:signal transduction histidine kinase
MPQTSLWESILVTLFFITNFFLGLIVFFHDKKNLKNRYFLGISVSLSFVVTSAYVSEFFPLNKPSLALFLDRLTLSSSIFFANFLLLFSFSFKPPRKIKSISNILYLLSSIIFLLTLFSPFISKAIILRPTGGFDIRYGNLYYFLFLPYILTLGIGSISNFLLTYRKLDVIEKQRIQYFLLGLLIFVIIAIISNVVSPLITGSEKYYRIGNYSSVFFIALTAYSIIKRRFLGIEVILTEILVGVIGILLIVQIFTAPSTLWRIVNGGIFVLYCIFGYLLIRGVFREIRRREEVEKISQAKSEFISITSHQLRTPLSAIKGYLSMVLEGTYGGISERVKKVLENVYTANERLIKLVNSFLDVSRIELGREELKLERISIEDLISETVSEMEIEAKKKNLFLKFEKPKIALPKILIDRGRIKEVISNLIDNAIKYTQKGGITIKSQISNGKCQISISDTGEGLTKEEISRLFESFSRGTAGAKFWTEGVGLGLYVSRKFVELHGGKIWAESEGKGKGSTFYIELPIK